MSFEEQVQKTEIQSILDEFPFLEEHYIKNQQMETGVTTVKNLDFEECEYLNTLTFNEIDNVTYTNKTKRMAYKPG